MYGLCRRNDGSLVIGEFVDGAADARAVVTWPGAEVAARLNPLLDCSFVLCCVMACISYFTASYSLVCPFIFAVLSLLSADILLYYLDNRKCSFRLVVPVVLLLHRDVICMCIGASKGISVNESVENVGIVLLVTMIRHRDSST